MKPTHLLRVEHPPSTFAALIQALAQLGLRAGWLRLSDHGQAAPETLPEDLEAAATTGVMRAVGISDGLSVAVKPRRGPAVLRDLLREHFRGCQVVLVDGSIEAPCLEPHGTDWRLHRSDVDRDDADRTDDIVLTSADLARRLRSPKALL